MATYDYTKGGGSEFFHQWRNAVWVPIDVDVPTIIASDSTLTTNATIGAGDIIQIYDIPADTIVTGRACLETITAGSASNTVDLGIDGGADYLFNGGALDADAGTMLMNLHTDTWGALQGVSFTATNTLDFKFVAAETVGRWVVWLQIVDLGKPGQVLGY